MLDLEPATRVLAAIVRNVRDPQLGGATPCAAFTVADLLDHVGGFCEAFTAAARKEPLEGPAGRVTDGSQLGPRWRAVLVDRLGELAAAWREPEAWAGSTTAAGVALPADVAGLFALDEVVVHGWDVAVATAQEFRCDPTLVSAVHSLVQARAAETPEGTPGLFGPVVAVPGDAPPLDRLLGLTGRDPGWRPDPARTDV